MPDNNQELINLGKTCVEIKTEVKGMKDVLDKLTENQVELVKFSERSLHYEKALAEFKVALNEAFALIRDIKSCRFETRVKSLESNQKWLVITILGAVIVTLIRGAF